VMSWIMGFSNENLVAFESRLTLSERQIGRQMAADAPLQDGQGLHETPVFE
jgi:hypothetical protein